MAKKANPKDTNILQPTNGDPEPPKPIKDSRDSGGCCLASDIPAPPVAGEYHPDQLILYGFKLNGDPQAKTEENKEVSIAYDNMVLTLRVNSRGTKRPISLAAIYGYAFEGQCYRLDRARLFLVNGLGKEAEGCGFGKPYSMWRIRARASIMEVAVSHDTADVLILGANLPGNRSPNTYGNHMMLAHRNGKLNRPGGA